MALLALSGAGCVEAGPSVGDAGSGVSLGDAGADNVIRDAGFVDGNPVIVDAGPINTTVTVESLEPAEGPSTGGYRVRIHGTGFTGACNLEDPDGPADNGFCRVTFGDVEATNILPVQLNTAPVLSTISVEVPPCAAPGPVRVRVQTELGLGELDPGFTCFAPVTVLSVSPPAGSTEGGDAVSIAGDGFSANMMVLLGGRAVVALDVDVDADTATFLTPPGVAGRADVVAVDEFGRGALPLAFTYVSPLRVDTLDPAVVDVDAVAGGAVRVDLHGAGFVEGAAGDSEVGVTFAGIGAAADNFISDARLRVRVPSSLGAGTHDVVATRGAQSASLADALVVLPPATGAFTVSAALPARLDVAGGTAVTVVGDGLSRVVSASVDGVAASAVSVVDERTVTFTAPAAAGGVAAAGAAAVVELVSDDGSRGSVSVAWFAPVVVDDVLPAEGPVAGGTSVLVVGRGFESALVDVRFGGIPASAVVVVDDGTVSAVTPAGAAGAVDVVVSRVDDGERGALTDGFRFAADVSALQVRPARGGVNGDTFVTITGSGFTNGAASVTFGTLPAYDVVVVNDSTITARNPPGQPGTVDVNVVVAGAFGGDARVDRAFTYFNPTSIVGGARGGPIDGAVYVTALAAPFRTPVPGLVAWVGTGDTPVRAGLTNLNGQATISGPEIVGPQTVTIGGNCFSNVTWVDVNATELTAIVFPICPQPPQPPPPPPPPPPAPPSISGRVFGFKKEFFDPQVLDQSGCEIAGSNLPCEIAFAEVTTTIPSEFSGAMFPGGANVVYEEGGAYVINPSRPGRLAVVAAAGILNLTNNAFRLRQLGFRREIFTEPDVDLIEQDVELTIDLDAEIDVSLPDAPLRELDDDAAVGFVPTITRVIPFMQLGGEGVFVWTQAVEGVRNHHLVEMPDVPGELFRFVTGAYTTDGPNLVVNDGAVSLSAGDVVVQGTETFTWGTFLNGDGSSALIGFVFVVDRPDGNGRFASVITGADPEAFTLELQQAPDFDVANAGYHIGVPGQPSSEVIQDGVGDLRSGVTISPVMGLPELLTPLENAPLVDRTLRWKAAQGQQPSFHDIFLRDQTFQSIWQFYLDGARTKVIIPRPPSRQAIIDVLPLAQQACVTDPDLSPLCPLTYGPDLGDAFTAPPQLVLGNYFWRHEAIFAPGLDSNNWSLLEISRVERRAWTTQQHAFTHGP